MSMLTVRRVKKDIHHPIHPAIRSTYPPASHPHYCRQQPTRYIRERVRGLWSTRWRRERTRLQSRSDCLRHVRGEQYTSDIATWHRSERPTNSDTRRTCQTSFETDNPQETWREKRTGQTTHMGPNVAKAQETLAPPLAIDQPETTSLLPHVHRYHHCWQIPYPHRTDHAGSGGQSFVA